MSNGVYRKYASDADGDNRKYALNADGDNRIDLSAEEQLALHDALNEQIVQHKISGLAQEIVHVVFHKTIRLHKRGDDLNGTCLSNLTSTGSRSDYVNGHVRELIANSVIIARLGHYGRILSINFNFEQWGQTPEYTRENGSLISDPEALLQRLDIPTKSEETENTDSHAPCENSVSNVKAQAVEDVQDSNFHAPLSVNTLSALLAEHIPANLALLITEDMIKQGVQKLIEFVTSLFKDTPIFEWISPLLQPQTQPENSDEILPKHATLTENHVASSKVEKNLQNQTETTVIEGAKSAKNQTQAEVNLNINTSVIPAIENKATTQAKDYEQLIFPTELKPYEQNQIIRILEKEAVTDLDTVQAVLDSMSSRFQVAMEPIKSPIAYFRHLLNRAKTGDFDRSYADIYQKQCQEKAEQESQIIEKQKSREAIDKYNEAKNNYTKLKLYLEHTDKSMRELAKDLGWLGLLEEMGFDLDIAKA